MSRPKGSLNKKTLAAAAASGELPKAGPTLDAKKTTDLTGDEEKKLILQYTKQVTSFDEKIAALVGSRRNVLKQAKGDGITATDIKDAQASEKDPEAQAAKVRRKAQIFAWMHPDQQAAFTFPDADRTPIDERAFEAGKHAGMNGEDPNPPHHFGGVLASKWMEGYHVGRGVNLDKIKQLDPAEGDGLPDAPSTAADPTSAADDDMRPAFLRSVK